MKRLVLKLFVVVAMIAGAYVTHAGMLQQTRGCNRKACLTDCRLSGCAIGFCDGDICRCTSCR